MKKVRWDKGASINNIHKIFVSPLSVFRTRNLPYCVRFYMTPSTSPMRISYLYAHLLDVRCACNVYLDFTKTHDIKDRLRSRTQGTVEVTSNVPTSYLS